LKQIQFKHLSTMILVAIICATLIGGSSLSIARAATSHVISGDTENFRKYEGFAPTMEPWEAGMVTNPLPGAFEWWYFQGQFVDGSKTQINFVSKPELDSGGPLQPSVNIGITTPNNTHLGALTNIDTTQFNAAHDTLNVTMGQSWARGDLNTVNIHVAPKNGIGADLVFKSAAPPTRFGGSGMWYLDPSLTRISATNDPMPFAKVEGNLTYGGQTVKVNGTGYFDKQWGNDGWYWSTGHYGNWTVDTLVWNGSAAYNHQQTQDMYLAKGNGPSKAVLETMQDVNATTSGKPILAPGGQHTYPEVLTMQWKKGTNSVTLTLTDPEVVVSRNPNTNTNASMFGYPQYMRLQGNGTLNVQWDGSNETASAPAVWEVFYTH
jgi:CrtC N-terminal lipocalin domain